MIMNLLNTNLIDTASISWQDKTRPDWVYDLNSEQGIMNFQTALTQGAQLAHSEGWKVYHKHTLDRNLAAAFMAKDEQEAITSVPGKAYKSATASTSPQNNIGDQKGQSNSVAVVKMEPLSAGEAVWKPKREAFGESVKNITPKQGIKFHVLRPIISPSDGTYNIIISLECPNEVWSLRSAHITTLFAQRASDCKYDLPDWQDSFHEKAIRKTPYGSNEYRRRGVASGKVRTVNRMFFVMRLSPADNVLFKAHIVSAVKKLCLLFHKDADPGYYFLMFLKENATGILDYFRKTHQTDNALAEYFDKQLVDVFSRSHDITYGSHLDRFLMDNDIKVFLQSCGITNWDEAPMEDCYKNYPRINVPKWDDVEHKSYTN